MMVTIKKIPLPTRWVPMDIVTGEGKIFIGCTFFSSSPPFLRDSKIICLDKNGRMLWARYIHLPLGRMLLARGTLVCLGTFRKGGIVALDTGKGNILWKVPPLPVRILKLLGILRLFGGAIIAGGVLVSRVINRKTTVEGRSLREGNILWKFKMPSPLIVFKLRERCLLFLQNAVYYVNPLTGDIIWKRGFRMKGRMVFENGVLVVPGEISLWNPHGLVRRRKVNLRPRDVCRSQEMIFVIDYEDRVWAFTERLSLKWMKDLRKELSLSKIPTYGFLKICGKRLVVYGLVKYPPHRYRTLAIVLLDMGSGKILENLIIHKMHPVSGWESWFPLTCENSTIYTARPGELLKLTFS